MFNLLSFDRFCRIHLNGNGLTFAEFKAFKLTVLIYIQSFFVGVVFANLHYKAGGMTLLYFSIVVSAGSLISLFLFKYEGLRHFSKLIYITLCNLLVYFNSKAIGPLGGLQYFYGVTIIVPFLMFKFKNRKISVLYSLALPVILAIFTPLFRPDFVPDLIIPIEYLNIYRILSTLSVFVMIISSNLYFHSTIEINEKDIKSKNQLLLNSEKMISLGILASGIAHEVNNPLSIIKLSSASIKKYLTEVKDQNLNRNDLLAKITKVTLMADRIGKIVGALKTYTRNGAEDPMVVFNLSKVITESLVLVDDELAKNDIAVEVSVAEAIYVIGRESQLIQVVTNLLKNAVDSIKNNKTKWIKIKSETHEEKVIINILDSGQGIDKVIQPNLFIPFFTTKAVGEGTGLGLYISKNLMESMSGSLHYDNSRKNTLFVLSLNAVTSKKMKDL